MDAALNEAQKLSKVFIDLHHDTMPSYWEEVKWHGGNRRPGAHDTADPPRSLEID